MVTVYPDKTRRDAHDVGVTTVAPQPLALPMHG
jgi:hypothetical protein